ncbi:hypothetical protein PoB_001058100 [Plakobranchus ocellatus]|uniref:Uncharacterized protein n=1 Tax=Plakobranchus ocellatus TaxID=259542 RepID=A0AAV3YLA7_9GAST|nr:hypothetical protein PoB_001058100 [Plakobranchus ocellatus]
MAAEILDIPTEPYSPTTTPPAYDVEGPVFSGESEIYMSSLTPSDGSVSSAENHKVAQSIKEIKRHRREAADAQTSQAERMMERSRVDLRAGEQGDNVVVPVLLVNRS